MRALELEFCCWQTGPLACIQALHQQGLVCIASRRKLTPKAFPEWGAGVLLCWSQWMAVMTLHLITGCGVALVAVWPHSVWWLAMVLAPLYTAAFRGGCACDSRGTRPGLGCLHAQLALRSRVCWVLLALLVGPLNLISEHCKIATEQINSSVPAQQPWLCGTVTHRP